MYVCMNIRNKSFTCKHRHCCRLACTVMAQQCRNFVLAHVEAQVVHCHLLSELFRQPFNSNSSFCVRWWWLTKLFINSRFFVFNTIINSCSFPCPVWFLAMDENFFRFLIQHHYFIGVISLQWTENKAVISRHTPQAKLLRCKWQHKSTALHPGEA